MMKFAARSTQGFSLVELMVVVGIIGVLAAIGIPQYAKFQAKARSSEAKVVLANVDQLEKMFQADAAEYTVCLASIGVQASTTRYYSVGFGTNTTPAQAKTSATGTTAPCTVAANISRWDSTIGIGGGTVTADATTLSGSTIGPSSYIVEAAGKIGGQGGSCRSGGTCTVSSINLCDVWSVRNDRPVANLVGGGTTSGECLP